MLNEIKPVNVEDFVVFEDGVSYSYVIDRGCKEDATVVDNFQFYTTEQIKEYAKECIKSALKEYVAPYSDKKVNSIISRIVK
jgi:hypothetical protein|nr:MAG TPA: hypothetical protein [Caudoviricetes sp.]